MRTPGTGARLAAAGTVLVLVLGACLPVPSMSVGSPEIKIEIRQDRQTYPAPAKPVPAAPAPEQSVAAVAPPATPDAMPAGERPVPGPDYVEPGPAAALPPPTEEHDPAPNPVGWGEHEEGEPGEPDAYAPAQDWRTQAKEFGQYLSDLPCETICTPDDGGDADIEDK